MKQVKAFFEEKFYPTLTYLTHEEYLIIDGAKVPQLIVDKLEKCAREFFDEYSFYKNFEN